MMIAEEKRPPNTQDPPPGPVREMIVHWCAGLLVVTLGALSVIEKSADKQLLESRINIHTLFALTLLGWLLARYHSCMKRSRLMGLPDIRALSRYLARLMYLMIYAVVGIKLCVSMGDTILHGAALDDPKGDLSKLFVTALIALAMIRVLAFISWLRAPEREASAKTATAIPVERMSI